MSLVAKYVMFAVLATVVNIACQDIVVRSLTGKWALWWSVLAGTAAGLLLKYYLDKRYIFNFVADGLGHDTRTFAVYTLMGLVTTVIFWGFEFGFEWLFNDRLLRYFGAVIGLGVGYFMKYHLDKRFVFARAES